MRITVVGANGFVGSAFVRLFTKMVDVELVTVTRQNYNHIPRKLSDITIHASGLSKKYLAVSHPMEALAASATHRLQTLLDFPADLHVHISSVDALFKSAYGDLKLCEETLVKQYAHKWLIFRLGGMVGPGLSKGPVYDVLNHKRLWVQPWSLFPFLHTDTMAEIVMNVVGMKKQHLVLNLAGNGVVSVNQIAQIAHIEELEVAEGAEQRQIIVNLEQIESLGIEIPTTLSTIESYVADELRRKI